MTWRQETADLLATSLAYGNPCIAGHQEHDMKLKHVVLDGSGVVPDFPPFEGRFRREVNIALYDWRQYEGIPVYCPGNDAVSMSIDVQGVWEGFETLLFLDILARDSNGLFVDLGSQIGWYSLLAACWGTRVLSVDADPENLRLLEHGAKANGLELGVDIVTSHAWLGPESPQVQPGEHVRLLKADVEGAEIEVARIWRPLFEDRSIDYALMEVTPSFSDRYPEVIGGITSLGYSAHVIPDKGFPPNEFAADPLGVTMSGPALSTLDISSFDSQQNILLSRL